MPTRKSPTLRNRRLGAELRRLREQAGMTLDQVAAAMDVAPSTVSRMENGRSGIRTRDVRLLLDLYQVTDEATRQGLILLAEQARKRGWWVRYGNQLEKPYRDYLSLEAGAVACRTYQPQVVPGLLQTEDYTRALIEGFGLYDYGEEEAQALLAVRQQRRKALDRPEPLRLWAVIDEAVLRREIGGRAVLRDQLDYLLECSHQTNIEIQVLPFSAGAPAWNGGPFILLELPEPADLDVLFLENAAGGLYLEEPDEIELYEKAFNLLRATALPPKESREMITETAKDLA
ncbi:hypothetical protein TH66_21705 [Carbonactinospora thermoautotrophica]|uniref:Putative DNA-binding protein n=2 Tax=Carbonactinospora thermoautotrophica TaxID=1469144 RepID=A0A132MJC8_9ACTN|nr:helix-turn-helix transcriptional regulator [Carbonactinospora thermoautotrophica]KWW97970.1 hypothetical protein TH66_21705 [Carbonactinospora thermoautotrophica]KWX03125.1 putative DNA-binding protein [Carbonactinospora thermoautotrophica]KWX08433.1 hypothetical protein TR74_15040 [Carbonactinospora thermoautotrophica]